MKTHFRQDRGIRLPGIAPDFVLYLYGPDTICGRNALVDQNLVMTKSSESVTCKTCKRLMEKRMLKSL